MKKSYLLTLLAFICLSSVSGQSRSKVTREAIFDTKTNSRSSSVFTYALTTLSEPYTDLTGATSLNNGEIWDDPDYIVPVTFPFILLGTETTFLEFYGLGSLLRSTTGDPLVDAYVFPFEVDLIDRGSNGDESLSSISYKVEGTSGNHILKVEWQNAGSYYEMDENGTLNMFVNFQLWLFEGSNKIEFHFGSSFIDDPELFYGGESGAGGGVANYNETDDIITNPHFLTGSVSDPILSMVVEFLSGTPSNGTVYRLSLDEPLEVNVTGENATSACAPNGSATANVMGGIEPYTYQWNNGGATQTIINLDAGIYSVTVSDANSNTATGSVQITNVDPLLANALSTDETGANANDGTATAIPTGGTPPYSYLWSNASNDSMIEGLAPGPYSVTVTDSEDCTSEESVIVNAFGCPELIIEGELFNANCFQLCDGSIQITNIIEGIPPFTYTWSNGTIGNTITNVCAGEYSVTVIDGAGCIVSATYTITEPPPLFANAASTNESGPGENDGTAWAVPTGGVAPYTYQWSNGSVDSLIFNLTPGSYTVTVTDVNFCSTVQSVVVDLFACPVLTLEEAMWNINCTGLCDAAIQITGVINGAAPFTYEWSNGSPDALIEELCPGLYSVTVTDANGCTGSETYQITEQLLLNANAGSTAETSPGANDGTAWAAPTGGIEPYLYAWSNGSADSLITGLPPGEYTVIVTESGYFCNDTQTVVVNAFPCIGVIQSGFIDISCFDNCDGAAGVILLGGIGPITYLWNTGDTTNTIDNLCPGLYSVTINDAGQNCFGIVEFVITEPEQLDAVVVQIVHLTDSTTTAISIGVMGGTLPYMFAWSGPNGFTDTLENLSDIAPGFYSLMVTDANGCGTSIDSIEVRDESVSTTNLGDLNVRVYPNPANDQLIIDIPGVMDYQVQIQSYDGRILTTWNNVKIIIVSGLNPGIYILKITSGEKFAVHRLIILR